MLKISKLADYATVVMVHFTRYQQTLLTAKQVSEQTGLKLPTVSKLLKILTASNLLVSYRGTKGGYALSRDAEAISVADIIACVEGKPNLTACSEAESNCVIQQTCQIKGNWQLITQAVQSALESVSLADFARQNNQNADFKISVNELRRVMSDDTCEENTR